MARPICCRAFAWSLLLVVVLCPSAVRSADSARAYLTIAYESTDVSHVACLLEYPGKRPRWIGFGPRIKYKVVAQGAIDAYSIERQIERYVRLRVDARALARAEKRIRESYRDTPYVLGVFDCVTFATDLAEHAGLRVPSKIHYQVENLIDELAERNASRLSARDRVPYPWRRCPLKTRPSGKRNTKRQADMVKVKLESIECREAESIGVRDRLYLIAYTDTGKKRKIQIGKLGDGDSWRKGLVLFEVPRGTAVGIRLWDADRFNRDDLVYQASFTTCRNGHFHQAQTRGRAVTGSTSVYSVRLSLRSSHGETQ